MEEKREPIKVRLTTVVLVSIIILLLLVIVAMYFYYNSKRDCIIITEPKGLDNVNTTIDSNQTNSTANENMTTSKVENLDTNSELVKKLYNYIVKNSNYDEISVYQSNKVTNETISEKLKRIMIFNGFTKEEADDVIKKEVGLYNAASEEYIYKEETVEKKAKAIFNKEIQHKEFKYEGLGEGISYENGKYEHYYYQGGGDAGYTSTATIIKAEKQGDELFIYDKYIHIYGDNTPNPVYYKDSEKKNKTTIDGYANYKHTFKKNTDGSYYWYSTEPME